MKVTLAIILSLLFVGPAWAQTQKCITADEVKKEMDTWGHLLQKTYNIDTEMPKDRVKLIEDGCWVKKYVITVGSDQYRAIVFKDSSQPDDGAQSHMTPVIADGRPREKCFEDARAVIQKLSVPWAERVLNRNQKKHAGLWKDLDVSPAYYLKCPKEDNVEFFESIATMLHEATHENANDPCIYDPFADRDRCLEHTDLFPGVAEVKFQTFPTKNEREVSALTSVQRMYFEGIQEFRFFNLPYELMSYAVELRFLAAVANRYGMNAIMAEDGRSGANSNLFLVYISKYINQWKNRDPKSFGSLFGPNTENRKNILSLLAVGEEAYLDWKEALTKAKEPMREFEEGTWKLYQEVKPFQEKQRAH